MCDVERHTYVVSQMCARVGYVFVKRIVLGAWRRRGNHSGGVWGRRARRQAGVSGRLWPLARQNPSAMDKHNGCEGLCSSGGFACCLLALRCCRSGAYRKSCLGHARDDNARAASFCDRHSLTTENSVHRRRFFAHGTSGWWIVDGGKKKENGGRPIRAPAAFVLIRPFYAAAILSLLLGLRTLFARCLPALYARSPASRRTT